MSAIEQREFDLENGRLACRLAGDGPALLLLHSLGLSGWMWEEAIADLAADFQVIAPDFPGYGKSPRPDSAWVVEDYAKIVLELAEELGISEWHVVGNSFGSLVAAAVASAERPTALSLTVLGMPIWAEAGGRFDWLRSRTAPLNPDGSAPPATKETASALLADPDDEIIARMNEDRATTGPWYQQTMWALACFNPDPVLAGLDIPVLVAYGEGDPFKACEPVALERIKGAESRVIEGGGHFAPLDAPKSTVTVMREFLGRVDG